MEVYKFGGASVKNAEAVKNLLNVLKLQAKSPNVVVVSAMDKTTNALEAVVNCYFIDRKSVKSLLQDVRKFHSTILIDLFEDDKHPIYHIIGSFFEGASRFLDTNKSNNYNFVYDQIVGVGELASTSIISHFLNDHGIENEWLDARELIKTDDVYRSASLNLNETQNNINRAINLGKIYITQGFIGSDSNNFTTTLGREGSDYSAAIFGYCINASAVTVWKDVPGILNADPKVFDKAQLIPQMSYNEAIEQAYYGATVIHPKTLQPLYQKEIPLFVKSFQNPNEPGTAILKDKNMADHICCYMILEHQTLITLSTLDFSYIMEKQFIKIAGLLDSYHMKVRLTQNSAISLSVCFSDPFNYKERLLQDLRANYKLTIQENVKLYTITNPKTDHPPFISSITGILMKQFTEKRLQFVTTA